MVWHFKNDTWNWGSWSILWLSCKTVRSAHREAKWNLVYFQGRVRIYSLKKLLCFKGLNMNIYLTCSLYTLYQLTHFKWLKFSMNDLRLWTRMRKPSTSLFHKYIRSKILTLRVKYIEQMVMDLTELWSVFCCFCVFPAAQLVNPVY